MPWPQAAVFDYDGLLADTAACWRRAYAQTLASYGRQPGTTAAAQLLGASVETAAAQLQVPAWQLRLNLRQAFQDSTPPLLPGARELVTALAERMPLAVATNAPGDLIQAALHRTGLHRHFRVIAGAQPQRKPKPAPDVYAAACHALGIQPSQAVALEDSPVGILAARAAGLTVILVAPDSQHAAHADLHVPRLDHPRLLELLRLPGINVQSEPRQF